MEITIRSSGPEDAAIYQRIHGHPEVYFYTLQLPHPSLTKWRDRLTQYPTIGNIGFIAEVEGQAAGEITLFTNASPRRKHTVSFGIGVLPEYSGRGVGAKLLETAIDYAFNWLAAVRMELEVFTDNEKAIRLYKKFGFKAEGVQEKAAFRDGRYCDVMMMAKIRSGEPSS